MSIWCSTQSIGFDDWADDDEDVPYGGQVRSYASGWSNHYPTVDGTVERDASPVTVDEYAIPDHIDPARWPFNEQRAREAAARIAYPDPPQRSRQRDRYATAYRSGEPLPTNPGAAANARAWQLRRRLQKEQPTP